MSRKKWGLFFLLLTIAVIITTIWLYTRPPVSTEVLDGNQVRLSNSGDDKTIPTCEELNIPQEQIDAAVAEAITDIENPWGNVSDFQLLIDRVQEKLHCTIKVKPTQ